MVTIEESTTAMGCVAESTTCQFEKMPPAMQASLKQFNAEAEIRTRLCAGLREPDFAQDAAKLVVIICGAFVLFKVLSAL